jgi:hypothetical protein
MGADMIAYIAKVDNKYDEIDFEARIRALTDEQITEAVEWAHQIPFEDLEVGVSPQEYALECLHELVDTTSGNEPGFRIVAPYILDGQLYWMVGGQSWGDTPEGYDALALLDQLGVLAPSRWDQDNVQFPRLLAEIMATQEIGESRTMGVFTWPDMISIARSMDLSIAEVFELFNRAQARWEQLKEELT